MFKREFDNEANAPVSASKPFRLKFILAGSLAAFLSAGLAFSAGLTFVAERSVERQAERLATAWAQFFGSQFDDLEQRLATGDFHEPLAVFNRTKSVSEVFRFKLFDSVGRVAFVSDEPTPVGADGTIATHNAKAAAVYETGTAATFVEDGTQKPNRPDVYAESYVPVLQNGKIAGVVEVYIDQTANAAAIRSTYLTFGVLVVMLILLAAAVPIFGLARARRSLKRQNQVLTEARDAALQAEQAKSEFLANMSHEIRTPMNGVLGMIELLAGTKLSTQQKMFTDTVMSSAQSLLAVINDILDFSKIDAGQLKISDEPFKVGSLINETAQMLSSTAFEKHVELLTRIDPNLPAYASSDYSRLRQIATNLLGNAIKFTDRGEVVIDASLVGEDPDANGCLTMRLEVRDTGAGIAADKLESIFGKFTQVDGSTTRTHEGTGLGLAICKGLVELMDGRIGVQSTLGQGSTFWIEVPLRKVRPETVDQTSHTVEARGKRVLVIDDNATNRWILAELLSSWRMEEMSASSGQEGLQKLISAARNEKPIDLVILDHHMPGMDGEEVLQHIRETPALADTPVIALTSLDNFGEGRDEGLHAPNAALVKPVSASVLLDQIMVALSKVAAKSSAAGPDPARLEAGEDVSDVQEAFSAILVVEDNIVNQTVAREMLKTLGFVPAIAQNGKEGVQTWRACRPKLVLMDVSMPIVSGYEATALIREIEAEEERPPTVIIGMTAHAMEGDRERCIEAGMDNYLPKPLSINDLKSALLTSGVLRSRDENPDAQSA